jgi:hypothetical protein
MKNIFNIADEKVEVCIRRAQDIHSSNPNIYTLAQELDIFVQYRAYFERWYGSTSNELMLVQALVSLCHMISSTVAIKESAKAKPEFLSDWIGEQPIRNAMKKRISRLIENLSAT